MAARKTDSLVLHGSRKAKQIAAAVLETLAGELSTSEAAARLSISLSRYYQLEARALQGLLEAVEPRAKGPRQSAERARKLLEVKARRLEKELRRHQALLRAAHRSLGLSGKGGKGASCPKRVRKRRGSRGQTVLATLCRDVDDAPGGSDGTTQRPGEPAGGDRGQRAEQTEAGGDGADAAGIPRRGAGV